MLKDDSFRTGTSDSRIYDCGIERAMADHFLLRCSRYSEGQISHEELYIWNVFFWQETSHEVNWQCSFGTCMGRFTDTSAPGHFGPKTLWHLYLVPKCPGHFGTGAEMTQDTLGRCGRSTAGESDSDVSMRTHVSRTASSCFAILQYWQY